MEFSKDARSVKSARVVVHTLGTWPNGTMSDNHWSIYLILDNNATPVRVDTRAELTDPKGILDRSDLSYTLSTSAIQY